jgi:hypothetical protein
MRIDGVIFLKGKGHAVLVGLSHRDEVMPGDDIVRASDGAKWAVVAVDLPLCKAPLFPSPTITASLLLSDEDRDIAEGDEVSVVPSPRRSPVPT